MALSSTTVGGIPVPGLLQSIGSPASPVLGPSNPVGVKAASPTTNIAPATTTLTKTQAAPINDLSGSYANVGGTIYNKTTNTAYSKPEEFFSASGVNSFNNLKFDTAWQPPKTTPQASPAPSSQPAIPPIPTPSTLPALASASSEPTNTTTNPNANYYTPPNQGTTGVSQGGIIGNQITNAINNPKLDTASADLKKLKEEYAKASYDIGSRPEGLTQQSGQQGLLQQLYATKLGAAETAVSNALAGQSNTTSGLSAAGGLNAPITNPQTGGLVSPSTNTTTGATTSGAQNLSSLVGQRVGADGKTTEFYDSQTGQGFPTPQALADFVNKQQPGVGATAQNVFDILKNQSQGGNGNGALNPLNNVASIAQQVINGQISPSQAYSMGGTVANWQGLLNQELAKQSGGSFDQSAAQAKYDANQSVQGSQAQMQAAYESAHQQAQNLQSQLVDLISKFGLNPADVNAVNSGLQTIAANVSDSRYKILLNYLTDVASRYAQILTPVGGSQTDSVRNTAQGMLDSTAKGQSITNVLAALDEQAKAVISGVKTPSTTGGHSSPAPTASSGSSSQWNW